MDIPVIAMVLRSGGVARTVLLILGVFSVVSWAIIFNRALLFSSIGGLHRRFRRILGDSPRLADLGTMDKRVQKSPMGQLGVAGAGEYQRILDDAAQNRAMRDWSFFLSSQFDIAHDRLDSIIANGLARFDRGLVFLALISSASPFLGLFGTVWGVMNSFFQIGSQGSASLPVVAPGIAEALITTVIGLAVAIPAVIFYNIFMHRVERAEDELAEAKERVMVRLKREVLNQFYGAGNNAA